MQEYFFCTLGGDTPGISRSMPSTAERLAFPMIISCLTLQKAEEVMKLQTFISGLDFSKPATTISCDIASSQEISMTLRVPNATFYPVVCGKHSLGIHRRWADIEAFMIKPCTKFTRFQTLHESMIYLILQGSEDLCKAVLWDKMAAPGTPPPHNSTANTTPPSNGIDTPSLVYADSLERALNKFGFERDNPQSPSDVMTGSLSTAKPPITQVPVAPFIFSRVCNLSGIVASVTKEHPHDDTPLPFLGTLAMAYLRSHGYDVPSVLHIFAVFQAASTPEQFANILAHRGLPLTEGDFLWRIIDLGQHGFLQV